MNQPPDPKLRAQMNIAILGIMTELRTNGIYTYDCLAQELAKKLDIPLSVAQRNVIQFAAEMGEHGLDARLSIETRPTIAESVAEMSALAESLRPAPVERAPWHKDHVTPEFFAKFKPKRSAAKWLQGAPEYVLGCYDRGGAAVLRYTVALGGPLWTPDYAFANWRAGLDPRVTPCLKLSVNPTEPDGTIAWGHTLLSRRLGTKIKWFDVPWAVRTNVTLYVHTIERSRRYGKSD